MISLGIESTAHTFGVGIMTSDGIILSDKRVIYKPPLGTGIHPRKAAQHHIKNGPKILKEALKESKLNFDDIDLVSFSQGPGLPNCLQIGGSIARFLSQKCKKPIIGVNHCVAHIEIGRFMTKCYDPVVVYCSGGNTQIIAYTGSKYRIFGETEDIPIGNAFDVLARYLGLEMPGGPKIEELAIRGKWIELPYVVKGMDLSFTGIITECKKMHERGISKKDICYSFQETVYAMLAEVTERALAHTNKNEVLLVGGVAASRRLQEIMKIMCNEREAKFYVVPGRYASDCGINIAWTGILAYEYGQKNMKIKDTKIKYKWRTDDVEIYWIK